ncbi:MAG TPA: 3-deoxy-D-manno-octulosonic acid transferase [Candidatus Cloacimonetes bacterium]|nr:3-deoxy-D-manno-octulosonic acid transferase [Candidatus Cloacimonadota bacterium]
MKLPLTYFIFNSILEIVYFLGYPIVRYVVKRRYDLQAMRIPEKRSDNPILIHAASVGEINAVMPLLRYLEEKQIPFVINTMSITGRDHAQKAFPDISVRLSALDIGSLRKRQLESLNPRLILIVETEIWPNLLAQASLQDIPIVFINARIGQKTLKPFMLIRSLLNKISGSVQCIIAQSKEDKQRFEKLFDMPIIVGGNLKFNVALPAHDSAVIRAQWGFQESDYIAVWGSSRPGEEELMLAAFSEIKRTYPEFKLILAPRHPDRSDEVASLLEGYSYVRLSELDPGVHDFDILLIDSLGKLSMAYACCDLAIVGGSFFDFGGHNPLEPVYYAKPTIIGSYHRSCRDSVAILKRYDAIKISTQETLKEDLSYFIANQEYGREMGRKGKYALTENASALDNHIKGIEKWI